MLSNYLKIAFRSMMKQKAYSAINIFGLTVAMTACILIVLWVVDETQYDRFHSNADRIYRATWNARYGDNEWNIPLAPVPLAPTLEKEFPEVEKAVRFRNGGLTFKEGNEFVREQGGLWADESFFDVFTVQFLSGDPRTALRDPGSVVLTEKTAAKYFAGRDPLGQTLEVNDGTLLRVTGIVSGFPREAHFHFDFLCPLKSLPIIEQRQSQWGSATVYTYVLLREHQTREALSSKLDEYVQKNIVGDDFAGTKNFSRFPLTPLLDLHLTSHLRYELEANGDIVYVYVFSVIAILILGLACINFVNLATARSIKRAREVGMRKVLGSVRSQLMGQFFAEAFLHVLTSVLAAIALTEILLPFFGGLSGKELTSGLLLSFPAVAAVLLFICLVTLLAGGYPALVLSSFRPIEVLKGGASKPGKPRLRKILVVIQFSISIILIVGTLVVQRQLQFVQNKNLGFEKEQVLVIHRASAVGKQASLFRFRLTEEPAVMNAAAAQFMPGQTFDSMVFSLEQPATYQNTSVTYDFVDPQFADVLKLRFLEGRNFSSDLATDSSAFILNQTAARTFGWENSLGKTLELGNGFIRGPVIGVVEDFHFESLRHEVKPMILMHSRWTPSNFAVRLRAGQTADGIDAVRKLWAEFAPSSPLEFSFLDDDYQRLYDNEQRVEAVFLTFSSLAVTLACLGLFGLASYVTEQRTKEIGIRKTLGATSAGIMRLLLQEFGSLILISFVIAVPLGVVVMSRWLQDFAYRTPLGWDVFVLAAAITVVITLLSVGVQSLRAALINPADSMRYE